MEDTSPSPIYSRKQLFAIRKSLGEIQKVQLPAPFAPVDNRLQRDGQRGLRGVGANPRDYAYVPSGNRTAGFDRWTPPSAQGSESSSAPQSALDNGASLPRPQNSKAQFMQQLVSGNHGTSMEAFSAAIAEHKEVVKEADAEAAAKSDAQRAKAEQKKILRQEAWKKKQEREDAERWGSVGNARSKQLSFEQERLKMQQSWRNDCTPTTMSPKTAERHAEIDKMFAADVDESFSTLPFEEAVDATAVRSLLLGSSGLLDDTDTPTSATKAATKSRFGNMFGMNDGGDSPASEPTPAASPAPTGLNSNVMDFFASAVEASEPRNGVQEATPIVRGAVTLDQIEGSGVLGSGTQELAAASNSGHGKSDKKSLQQQQQMRMGKGANVHLAAGVPEFSTVAQTAQLPVSESTPTGGGSTAMSANAFFAMIQSTQPSGLQAMRGQSSAQAPMSGPPPGRKTTTIDLATLFGGTATKQTQPSLSFPAGVPRTPDSPGTTTAKFNASIADIFGK